jgi:hypothetical protein
VNYKNTPCFNLKHIYEKETFTRCEEHPSEIWNGFFISCPFPSRIWAVSNPIGAQLGGNLRAKCHFIGLRLYRTLPLV